MQITLNIKEIKLIVQAALEQKYKVKLNNTAFFVIKDKDGFPLPESCVTEAHFKFEVNPEEISTITKDITERRLELNI